MTEQLELDMRGTVKPGVDRARDDARDLVGLLRSRPDLRRTPASRLAAALGWDKRRVRTAAEASNGQVLSAPGVTGYRLAEETTVASYFKIERARYRSQIRVMEARLVAMDRAVHAARAPER